MNQAIHKTGLCALVCLLAAGCHSSTTTPAPAAQTAAVAPQPAVVPVAAAPAAPKQLTCTGKLNNDAQGADLIGESALYMLMNSKLGGWTSCVGKTLSKTDDQVVVTFVGGSTFTVSSYPSSDAAAQEAVLTGTTALTREDVIKALKQDQPQDSCGVDWKKLSAGGPNATGDFKASGTTCTLEIHVKMQNGSVVGFGFGVAA